MGYNAIGQIVVIILCKIENLSEDSSTCNIR